MNANARLFCEISSSPATIWRAALKLAVAYQRTGWGWMIGDNLSRLRVPEAREIAGLLVWLLSTVKPGAWTGSGGITIEQTDHHNRFLVWIDPRLHAALTAHLAHPARPA